MAQLAIDSATWRRLSELLDQALEQPFEKRGEWLASLPPQYDALKPQLQDLLSKAKATGGHEFPTQLPSFGSNLSDDTHASTARSGELIGNYRLLEKLGHGGMGTVWLAERSDGLISRPVALKLPHKFAPIPGLAERMAREREILATLDHQNIARLFDAGLTQEGQPFLALEYVPGRTIDQYCKDTGDGTSATLQQRLELFIQIAHAVAYAHGRLIVHRDLKPANILVKDSGDACLLDFGIAKLLDSGMAELPSLTEFNGLAMTPNYASPEQLLGQPVTVASDIYSLGVILFELLTGERPYRLARESRGALEDAIVHSDPVAPSSVAPVEIRRKLHGDLDTIILKALKKRPNERYTTADAFADDIVRFLENRPVTAQPERASYRLRKFAQRNTLGVVLGATVCLAVLAGTSAALWQASEATLQRDLALLQRQRAENVKNLVVDIFRDANPDENGGKRPLTAELLRRAALKIESATIDDPLVRAEMLRVLGASLMSIKDFEGANSVLDRAAENAKIELAPNDLERLRLSVLRSDLLRYIGREKAWRAELDQVTPHLEVLRQAAAEDYVTALKSHAHWSLYTSQYVDATRWAERANQAAEEFLGVGSESYVRTLTMLAATHTFSRDAPRAVYFAERAHRGALAVHRGNETHPTVIDSRRVLGLAYDISGRPARARELLQIAIRDGASIWGASNATVGYYFQFLSNVERRLGLLPEATESARKSLAIAQVNNVAVDSAEYIGRENALALALLASRNTVEAEPLLKSLVEKAAGTVGRDHPNLRIIESDYALALALRGNARQALSIITQSERHISGRVAPERIHMLVVKGAIERIAALNTAAIATLTSVLDATPDSFRDNDRAEAELHLGLAHFAAGNRREAEARLRGGLNFLNHIEFRASPLRSEAERALQQLLRRAST